MRVDSGDHVAAWGDKNMRIEYLKELITLVDTKNYGQAAKLCNVSQSSFSKHIAAMEQELGFDLLDHSSKVFKLTKAGCRFEKDVRRILNEYDSAVKHAEGAAYQEKQTIEIGYYLPVSIMILKYLHRVMVNSNETFQIKPHSMTIAEIDSALRDSQITAGITLDLGLPTNNRYGSIPLGASTLLLAVPKRHELAKFDEVKLADLEEETFLRPDMSADISKLEPFQILNRLTSFRQGKILDDIETVMLAVQNNIGIAMAFDYNCTRWGDQIRFIHVQELDDLGYEASIKLIWRQDAEQSQNTSRQISFLKRQFSKALSRQR